MDDTRTVPRRTERVGCLVTKAEGYHLPHKMGVAEIEETTGGLTPTDARLPSPEVSSRRNCPALSEGRSGSASMTVIQDHHSRGNSLPKEYELALP